MSAEDRERWEARWRERTGEPGAPDPFLVHHVARLPPGPVLDVAAGDGRNALWLAAQGRAVTAVDISPTALERLRAAAEAHGLAGVATHAADLDEAEALAGLGPFAALVVLRYKPPAAQWRRLIDRLAAGGIVLLCSFGREQHARHGFPLAFCLDRAGLEATLTPGLRLLSYETITADDDACLEGSLWQKA